MELTFSSSVIFVQSIDKSKDFYTRILKREIEYDFGKSITFKGGLSIWEVPENHMIEKSIDNFNKQRGNPFEICFEIDDIEAFKLIVEENGLNYVHPIIEETWGQRVLRIYDPDGTIVEIGERFDIFVKRLYQSGLTIEQVSEKTSVPIDKVKEFIKE